MKQKQLLPWLAIMLSASIVTGTSAEQTATVKDNFVNVRGQANLVGEVITQLKKGETVTVLEEITVEKPNPGDPLKWARIKMPENTPVWLSAAFVDATNKTVSASRLNLRAGPGENYSVVGRLDRGAAVKEIRTIDGWMEIETPPGAYAFVASEYLNIKPDPNAPAAASISSVNPPKGETTAQAPQLPGATAAQQPSTTATAAAETPSLSKKNDLTPPASDSSKATAAASTTAPTPSAPDAQQNPATNPTATAPPVAATPTATTTPASASEPAPKRVVRREGIVRSTFNIQAPTYFELISPESRKTINYLHSDDPALKLKDFKGKKIIVTGEEGIDSRWPKTPVIEIESLEAAP